MVPESEIITNIRELLSKAQDMPEDVDARCWSLVKTKLEEALMWAERSEETWLAKEVK